MSEVTGSNGAVVSRAGLPVFAYPGQIAVTRSGEFLVETARGSVNFTGRKFEDGVASEGRYKIPHSAVVSVREKTKEERDAEADRTKALLDFRLGSVVTFKNPPKYATSMTRFVIFKTDGVTASVVDLGGNVLGAFYRNVALDSLNLVDVTDL